MRFRILFSFLLTALFVLASSCGTTPNCPVCGTTVNGAYAVINVIPVPEHNNSGEPGGPFNSFDISTMAPNPAVAGHYLDYVSDRIGIAVQVIDTSQDLAVFSIQGSNAVSGAGNGASPCPQIAATGTTPAIDIIPPSSTCSATSPDLDAEQICQPLRRRDRRSTSSVVLAQIIILADSPARSAARPVAMA